MKTTISKLKPAFAALALGVLALPAFAEVIGTAPAPELWLEASWIDAANGQTKNWSTNLTGWYTIDQDGDLIASGDYHFQTTSTINGKPLFSVDMQAGDANTGNVDPFMVYSMAVTNNTGGLLTFTRTQRAAILPTISGPNQVFASVSGSLTDATGNGVSITPAPNLAQDSDGIDELQIFRLGTGANPNGGPYTNAGVDVGLAETETGGATSFVYGAYQDGFTAGPAGSWNWMQFRTRFTLTGNGDVAAISGRIEITPVPEPSSYALMLAGLTGVGLLAYRRRSRV